jgi:hypothetical protein
LSAACLLLFISYYKYFLAVGLPHAGSINFQQPPGPLALDAGSHLLTYCCGGLLHPHPCAAIFSKVVVRSFLLLLICAPTLLPPFPLSPTPNYSRSTSLPCFAPRSIPVGSRLSTLLSLLHPRLFRRTRRLAEQQQAISLSSASKTAQNNSRPDLSSVPLSASLKVPSEPATRLLAPSRSCSAPASMTSSKVSDISPPHSPAPPSFSTSFVLHARRPTNIFVTARKTRAELLLQPARPQEPLSIPTRVRLTLEPTRIRCQ